MQFSTILAFASVASVAFALPQFGQASIEQAAAPEAASSNGSCSSGVAHCCSTVQSESEAKQTLALLGLNDVFGSIGLQCQQIPINAVGGAVAIQNQCKQTPVCCTGSHANGLIQASCTPLSIN